jgi:ATP phosphoribosyltransferase
MFTIALPKGALLKDSISTFKRVGLDFSEALDENNRSLTFESNCKRAKALLVRNGDVPVYVSYGQADLGIVGYDVLKESELKVAKLLDLGFGGCHMSLAVKKNSNYTKPTDLPANCKVASKFIKTARFYFEELNIPVEIVHLTGSVELGPITGMAEAIVDLVATGKTLKENGLIKIDDLFYSTARLIGNPLSMRLDDNHLRDTILSIESTNVI